MKRVSGFDLGQGRCVSCGGSGPGIAPERLPLEPPYICERCIVNHGALLGTVDHATATQLRARCGEAEREAAELEAQLERLRGIDGVSRLALTAEAG